MGVRHTLTEMQSIAASRGGECLSTEYVSMDTKMRWRCAKEHEWITAASGIIYDSHWCQKCYHIARADRQRLSIKDMQTLASSKGGKCISSIYVNDSTKILWECDRGHQWWAKPNKIKSGRWCSVCRGGVRGNIERIQKIAKQRGGVCLSLEYKNAFTPLLFRCQYGHEWNCRPADIVNVNTWCPVCNAHPNENLCRSVFEFLTKERFDKKRPLWLSENGRLELDGYNENLGIAFEYNGAQHYRVVSYFKGMNLYDRQKKDAAKQRMCKEHGVLLITIPYYIRSCNIHDYIVDIFRENKIPYDASNFDYRSAFSSSYVDRLRNVCKNRGGECLSTSFFGVSAEHKFRCVRGHIWEAKANAILRGTWCFRCARSLPKKKVTL